jgi:hypothetical protein
LTGADLQDRLRSIAEAIARLRPHSSNPDLTF